MHWSSGSCAACLAVALCVGAPGPALAVPPPTFAGDATETTREGNLQLKWEGGESLEYELQRSDAADFAAATTIYRGGARARFVSGLPDGHYHFRARAREGDGAWSPWSATKTLEVKHWPRSRALGLMGFGAVVFALTAGMILLGGRRHSEDAS